MRHLVIIIVLTLATRTVEAAGPASRPSAPLRRAEALSLKQAQDELHLLGSVQSAAYTTTFGPARLDPHQQFRDRYTFGLPAYSPYLFYGYGSFYCSPIGNSWITPASIFYGD